MSDAGTQPSLSPTEGGCWIAYYQDRSGVFMFGSEIDALRAAVKWSMQAKFVPWGTDPFDGRTTDDR